MATIEFSVDQGMYMGLIRDAVRAQIPNEFEAPASTMEIRNKKFDFDTQLGVAVSMKILSQNIGTVKWPRDWIEAFKERWFPEFMKKRWPVRHESVDITAIYPKAKLGDPVFKYFRTDRKPGNLVAYEGLLHTILRMDEKDRNEFMRMLIRDVYEIWEEN